MLGKPHWFKRRKYGGWGFMPATWQGWVYLFVMVAVTMLIVQLIPPLNEGIRLAVLIAWGSIILVDTVHIMSKMPKDERERVHEAIAERNTSWAIILVLCLGVAYQAAAGVVKGTFGVDPVILAALVVGVAVKAATNIYLDHRD